MATRVAKPTQTMKKHPRKKKTGRMARPVFSASHYFQSLFSSPLDLEVNRWVAIY
jgi:hypothetical protein